MDGGLLLKLCMSKSAMAVVVGSTVVIMSSVGRGEFKVVLTNDEHVGNLGEIEKL